MVISLIANLVKRLGAICIAFVICWHIAHAVAPRRGKAIMHVAQPDVVVQVDYREIRVDSSARSPVVCELEPGIHVARMRHGPSLLDEKNFTIEPGRETVVYLSDHSPKSVDGGRAWRATKANGLASADLAIGARPGPEHARN